MTVTMMTIMIIRVLNDSYDDDNYDYKGTHDSYDDDNYDYKGTHDIQ